MRVLEQRDRLGGYTINRLIRTGSTGQLYLGRRIAPAGFAPASAIKVFPEVLYDTRGASDLLDAEQISVSKIDDPRVARLEELGDDNGLRYIAMECVRGFSLMDMLAFYYERDRRIRPGLAVHIAMQAALGLQAAHETRDHKGNHLRLVHGGLTTKRVLVTWKGHVKLVRFGFANVMADEKLTSSQQLFRAPEMFDMSRVDARADVYALGAVLLASLARGGLPVLEGVVDRSAIVESLGRADGIPSGVGDVLVASMQPRRDDRPTALAFYRALVDVMPEALKITPSDVARELAAIRLDREFSSFAEDRPLVGASYVPPRMTAVPSPFLTKPPTASSEAAIASERLVVPKLPALPLLSSMMPGGSPPPVVAIEDTPAPIEETPPPIVHTPSPDDYVPAPVSSASLLPAARVLYPAASAAAVGAGAAAAATPAAVPSAPAPAIELAPVAAPSPAPIVARAPAVRSDALDVERPSSRGIVTRIAIVIAIAFAAGVVVARLFQNG